MGIPPLCCPVTDHLNPRFLAVMNPFRYKQYMNSGKVLTLTVVYCLSIVVMPSVASEHYSNSKLLFQSVLRFTNIRRSCTICVVGTVDCGVEFACNQ